MVALVGDTSQEASAKGYLNNTMTRDNAIALERRDEVGMQSLMDHVMSS